MQVAVPVAVVVAVEHDELFGDLCHNFVWRAAVDGRCGQQVLIACGSPLEHCEVLVEGAIPFALRQHGPREAREQLCVLCRVSARQHEAVDGGYLRRAQSTVSPLVRLRDAPGLTASCRSRQRAGWQALH